MVDVRPLIASEYMSHMEKPVVIRNWTRTIDIRNTHDAASSLTVTIRTHRPTISIENQSYKYTRLGSPEFPSRSITIRHLHHALNAPWISLPSFLRSSNSWKIVRLRIETS